MSKLSVIIIASLLLLTGCGKEPKPQKQANWDELCKITDCEQYPVGYSTVEFVDGSRIYFPIDVVEHGVGGFYSFGWFEDWSPPKPTQPKRTYVKNSPTDFRFENLLKSYGLWQKWPKRLDTPTILTYNNWGSKEDLENDRFFRNKTKKGKDGFDLKGYRIVSYRGFITNYDLEQGKYLSLDNNFWIIQFSQTKPKNNLPQDERSRDFTVLSKKPMLQGHHVYGECDRMYCWFNTVSNARDWKFGDVGYIFEGFSMRKVPFKRPTICLTNPSNASCVAPPEGPPDYLVTDCPLPNPVVNCDHADKVFAFYPKAFELLDQLINQLKIKPAPGKEAAQ